MRSGRAHEFIKFVAVGGFAALVNVSARIVLSMTMSYELAVIVAYLIGMATAYTLFRILVFEKSGRGVSEEFIKFGIVNVVALIQVWLVTMGLFYYALPWLKWTYYPEMTAHLVGVASPTLTSYFGHKYFSFRAAKATQPNAD